MCFARKPGLGHYSGSRVEWKRAYRAARIAKRDGIEPDPATSGIIWKAGLIVAYERADHNDPLTCPLAARLASKHIIDEIISG
jgi:hypothetical protein